jgi:Putative silver efflux pump
MNNVALYWARSRVLGYLSGFKFPEGVSEVGTIGGFLKEYQIDLNPYLMKAYDISFEDVLNVIKNNNQSNGYVKSLEDIENIFVKNNSGKSVKIKDIIKRECFGFQW